MSATAPRMLRGVAPGKGKEWEVRSMTVTDISPSHAGKPILIGWGTGQYSYEPLYNCLPGSRALVGLLVRRCRAVRESGVAGPHVITVRVEDLTPDDFRNGPVVAEQEADHWRRAPVAAGTRTCRKTARRSEPFAPFAAPVGRPIASVSSSSA